MNTSRPRSIDIYQNKAAQTRRTEIFDGDDLEFDDFLTAGIHKSISMIYNRNAD